MANSKIKAIINKDIHRVWEIVLDIEHYHTWRSDVSNTKILNDKQFVEYTKDGYATTFTTTAIDPYHRWEFDMENDNMKGHWIGIFTKKGIDTEIEFIEEVTTKKFFMKLFVKSYLKKQQAQFVKDLKQVLYKKSIQGD